MADPDATIDWSYSNAQLYASCPRSLFFRFCQRTGTEIAESTDDDILHGNSQSAGSIIGSAIHHAVADHIQRWVQNERTGLRQTQSTAESYIREAVSQSSESESLDLDSLSNTSDAHIETFFKTVWPSLRSQRYILHEQTRSFDVSGNTVWVRPDLCVRESSPEEQTADTFVIYDWKSRQPSTFEDQSLQLCVYALWANKIFEPDVKRISPRIVFTQNGRIMRQDVSVEDLTQLESRISTQSTEWNPPDQRSRFPTEATHEKCSTCAYLSSCDDGQKQMSTE